VIVLLLGIGLGWNVKRARVQRDAVTAIGAAGGSVRYDRQYVKECYTPNGRPRGFRWLRKWLSPDYCDVAVKFSHHAVNEAVLADLTKWVAESGDGKFSSARPASAPEALNPKAVWFALALGSDPSRTPCHRRE
jgi:hypothetical protein